MNTPIKFVTKANGKMEDWDESKILKWIHWSTLSENRVSEIMLHLSSILYDGIRTSDIQQAIINYCTSQDDYEFHKPAARLFLGMLYHKVFHKMRSLPSFKEFYKSRIRMGFWAEMGYTDQQLDQLSEAMDPKLDFSYTYSEMKSIYNTYLLKDLNKNPVETFQYFYMGISAYIMQWESDPVDSTIRLYKVLSQHKGSLPTPILSAARTGDNSFASCCLVESGDTADSIGAMVDVSYTMTTNRAGIGAFLNTRSLTDPVRNGKTFHTGKLPYFRYLAGAIKSTTQFARRGSGTSHIMPHDPELFSLLALKNIRTPMDLRIQEIDYSLEVNDYLIECMLKNKEWLLISKYYAPDLYDEFYNPDPTHYLELYEKYFRMVKNGELKGKIVKAREVMAEKMKQWVETGRYYTTFISNMNRDTPFYDRIHMSNLCQETMLPTYPLKGVQSLYKPEVIPEEDGEIALCNLGAIVAGKTDPDEYEEVAYIMLKAVDNTISFMDYPYPALKYTAQNRRSIGIGIIDFAHRMAMEEKRYDNQEGLEFANRWAEMHCYYLIKASLRLGKEKGNAPWIHRTRYAEGILPNQYYNKNVDEIVEPGKYNFDWDTLSEEVRQNGGIRNSVLVAHMPSEKSSQTTGSTNGLYPIREKVIVKSDGNQWIKFFPGGYDDIFVNSAYQNAYSIHIEDMIKFYAVMQKWAGQGISADFWYNPAMFENHKMGLVEQFKWLAMMNKYGLKSHYYFNSLVNADGSKKLQQEEDDSCSSGACKI